MASDNSTRPRQQIIDQIRILLGGNMVDIELEIKDIDTAIDIALDRYRQRSSNAMTEAAFFLTLRPEMQTFTLPSEVVEVSKILRRGLSANAGQTTGNQYDPFSLAYTNLYLLQPTGQGDLLTYELYSSWLGLAGRMFGAHYDFRWDARSHKLTIIRHQQVHEDVMLTAYMRVSDDDLLTGQYSRPWLRSYALAQSKIILGQAYEKFSSLPGPNGSVTLNGTQLKAEGQAEIVELENHINQYQDGSRPLPFLIG